MNCQIEGDITFLAIFENLCMHGQYGYLNFVNFKIMSILNSYEIKNFSKNSKLIINGSVHYSDVGELQFNSR